MGIEAIGKLHTIFDTKQVSERFSKREFVLEMADQKYPQTVIFQLTGDRCAQLDSLQVGDQVRVDFSLRGREWRSPSGEVKYFNSLDVWKVEAVRANQSANGGGNYRSSSGGGGGRSDGRSDSRGGGGGGRPANTGGGGDPRDADAPPRIDDSLYGEPVRTDDDLPF